MYQYKIRAVTGMLCFLFLYIFQMSSSLCLAPQQIDCSKLSDKDAAKRGKELAIKLNWKDAATYYQCAYEKKAKPEYRKELDFAKGKVADQGALEAEQLLKADDFAASSSRLATLRQYADTAEVQRVQAAYDTRAGGFQKQYAAALARAQNGDPDGALKQLQALAKFSFVLRDLEAGIRTVTDLKVEKLLSEGDQFIAQHKFDDASLRYQSVQAMRPEDQRASAGIRQAAAGRQAYFEFDRAREFRTKQNYKAAKDAIEAALRVYPDSSSEFAPMRTQIVNEWREFLTNSLGSEPENELEFDKVLPMYLNALQLRALDPANSPPAKFKEILDNLAGASAEKARTYKKRFDNETDPARLGTAYLLLSNAKQLGATDPAIDTDLEEILNGFARKRNTRLILSVDTTTVADGNFVQALKNRCRKAVEAMQLQDLSIFLKEDWEKNLQDPEKKNLVEDEVSVPADNKSAYILLKVTIDKFIKRDKQLEGSPRYINSVYVAGKTKVKDPEVEELFNKVTRVIAQFEKNPKDRNKRTVEGMTYSEALAYKEKLARLDAYKEIDEEKPYQYQEADYSQFAALDLSLKVIDNWSTLELFSGVIPKEKRRDGKEITNTKNEKDIKGNYNKELLWPPSQQDLDQLQTEVQSELDVKIPVLLKPYLDRFYNSGKRALEEKRYEDAVEDLFIHWAFNRGRLEPETSKLISDLIMDKTGFDLITNGKALITKLTERKR